MATVHDQLWRQADASEVDLASYLSSLAAAVATAAPRHATVVEVEPAMVSAGLAVPLGLLVNELVANAYKYAYAPGEEGEVRSPASARPRSTTGFGYRTWAEVCRANSISAAPGQASGCASSPAWPRSSTER